MMYGVFIQNRTELRWVTSEVTEAEAVACAEDDYNDRLDVDFVLVLPISHVVDIEGTRKG